MEKILQISLNNGNIIKNWKSATQVANELDFNASRIMMVCKGQALQSNGFFWIYEDIELQQKYSTSQKDYVNKINIINHNAKSVVLVAPDTFEVLETYESREMVANTFKVSTPIIKRAIRDKTNFDQYLIFDKEYYDNNKQLIINNTFIGCEHKCGICKLKFKTLKSLSLHLGHTHNLNFKKYTAIHLLGLDKEPTCKLCSNEAKYNAFGFDEYCIEHKNNQK
jgi:hypothetical protein